MASNADLVHAHCLWMRPLGYAAQSARTHEVPLVISPRGMLAPWAIARSRWKKRLARSLLHPGAFEQAAGWHATSEQEASDIRAVLPNAAICVAPNGIEASKQDPRAKDIYLDRAPELRGRRVLLFYSRLHSKKRVLELVREFSRLSPRHPAWHLLVVGLPEEYSVEQVREESRKSSVARNVTVLDGTSLPKPYSVAELFVLPSHDENFGRVVAEALAAGLPVVTSTRTPWSGIAVARAGAWVGLDAIPAELDRLLADTPQDLSAAGERGRRWVLASFDWEQSARALVQFYEDLRRAADR
jgi:glycosyltransferase involved in cell wall biosynthesis